MKGKRVDASVARRKFLTGLGAGAGVVGASLLSSPAAMAQVAAQQPWRPARYAQDDWYDKIPGVHRFIFDSTTAEGMGWALQFATNYFTASLDGYGLKDSDLAVVIVSRHQSAPFGFNDAMWAKYGKQLSEHAAFTDPKTKTPPAVNVYTAPGDSVPQAGRMDALIKRGVQFAVCRLSTRVIAGRVARATGVEADPVFNELSANLVGNARLVPAGILAVNRAQEHGYSFVYAI